MEDNTQSQTQPQVEQLVDDIFGDSDDEKNVTTVVSKPAVTTTKFSTPTVDSDDDIFAGSDKDEDYKVSDKKATQKMPSLADDNLLDSDDDDVVQPKKGFTRKKRPKGPVTKISKLKKRKTSVDVERSRGGNSGDEYDSGEDLGATKEDVDFLAEDDDFADIVKEYDEDNTNFNDDRPDDYDGPLKKKKKGSTADMPHHSSGINLKDQDPLSQTLAAMKNPKAKALSDQEKDILVEKLQLRMAKAVKMDNELYAQQQPATHKMALLEAVKTTLMMKPLHQTLLDKDILSSIRDWIEPRDANTLPALSVRATMYDLLMQLPCLPDHLKRSNNEKPPIGVTIVALRKHKMETAANKRTLKELMDKWSRPIFSKSADVRLGGGGVASLPTEHPEVQEAILQRYASQLAQSDKTAREAAERAQSVDGNTSSSSNTRDNARNVGFDSLMSGQQSDSGLGDGEGASNSKKKAADNYSRARTPYNTGFLFTVQPELKNIDKRNVMERSLGEGRMKLFKKMSEGGGGGGKGLGKKSNPRAMDMSVSVGPKH